MSNTEKVELIDEMEKAINRMSMALEGFGSDPDAKPFVKTLNKLIADTQSLSDKVEDDFQ